MRPSLNLSNQKIGHLTVLHGAPNRITSKGKSLTCWWCQCACGGDPVIVSTADLTSKKPTQTCGCGYQKSEYVEVNEYKSIAMRSYHWLRPWGHFSRSFIRGQMKEFDTRPFWLCRCIGQDQSRLLTSSQCEVWVRVTSADLRSGKVRSCSACESACKAATIAQGQRQRAWEEEHGIPQHMQDKATRECYDSMISRYTHEPAYRKRGIHEPWLGKGGYQRFLADMGYRTKRSLTVHRKDNSKGYFPWNCVWAPVSIQTRERSDSRFFIVDGQRMNLVDFAGLLGMEMWKVARWIDRLQASGQTEAGAVERIMAKLHTVQAKH